MDPAPVAGEWTLADPPLAADPKAACNDGSGDLDGGRWRSLHDLCVQRPALMAILARVTWGVEAEPLYRSIEQLRYAEHVTILDARCGGGVSLRALSPRQDVRYIAAERSPKLIARAERRARRRSLGQVEFAVADPARLPLRSGEADIALCHGGLHTHPDPQAALGELARCLRPGGLLTGTTFLWDDLGARGRRLFERGRRHGHALPPRREELFASLAEAGFLEATIGPQAGFAAFSAIREPLSRLW